MMLEKKKKIKKFIKYFNRIFNDVKMLKVLGIGDLVKGNLHSKKSLFFSARLAYICLHN